MMNKANCWEFKKCGRELNGKNVPAHGLCPVAFDSRLHGVHGGQNGGRCCWLVRSFCDKDGNTELGCSEDCMECNICSFYKTVESSTELLVTI